MTWVNIHPCAGGEIKDLVNLSAWRNRIRARPAVQRGLDVRGKVDPAAMYELERNTVVKSVSTAGVVRLEPRKTGSPEPVRRRSPARLRDERL